jgi:hypothetical protein
MAWLPAGVPVAAWRLGAISFVSSRDGVALTAPQIPCYVGESPTTGVDIVTQTQTVRLAVSTDGGKRWVTRGAALSAPAPYAGNEQIAATSLARVWAATGTTTLFATSDGGMTWTSQPLRAPVLDVTVAAGALWALSCPPIAGEFCGPVLERETLPAGRWVSERVPRLRSDGEPDLAVLSGQAVLLMVAAYGDGGSAVLASTSDGGAHWDVRPAPASARNPCLSYVDMAAAGPRDWWVACQSPGENAGSAFTVLMRSTNAGQSWTVVFAATSTALQAITAATPARLWLDGVNEVDVSTDAGRTWTPTGIDPAGWTGSFDALSSNRGWFLVPGVGLWQTTDGTTWNQLSPTGPYGA